VSTLLCDTVTGRTMAELIDARDGSRGADMVELRLDGIADLGVAGSVRDRRQPVVVTCRPTWEGGRFDGSEEERIRILGQALDCGADYVDVEWRTLSGPAGPVASDLIERAPSRIVLSHHDFAGLPADLADRVRAMRAVHACTIKVAVATNRLTDTLALRDIARPGDAVVIGMGEAGVPSRLLAARYGSRWTYGGEGVAPGQIPVSRMTGEFRFRQVGPETHLFGVVSGSAMHSLSPAIHNAAFAAAGVDAVYVPFQAADFDDFLAYAAAMGIEGASITIPFKVDALQAAAHADDVAVRVGAANTLRIFTPGSALDMVAASGGRTAGSGWEATNTDVAGLLDPLRSALGEPLDGLRAAVLGAGGAARAAIVALQSRGAHVTVHARREDRARQVAMSLGAEAGGWPPPPGSWDLLVNCTPLGGGARRNESPLPDGPFHGRLVYDLTYGPGESALVRAAREAGCGTLDGLPMLVAQAERQWEWWMGRRPPTAVMYDALDRWVRHPARGSTAPRAQTA
jgi:3-dehydroquinate dehydratase / shikimate dehydrogenase